MRISDIIENIRKYEVYYFYFFLLINLLPLLLFKFFPTVDGPAHLYNANLIVEILQNPGSRLDQFLLFNSNLNPNWTGHLILAGLLTVFPAWLSEKILVASFLLFFPISFRFFFHSIGLKKNILLYFIFPFTYSFLFQYGFYNFHLGLIFLFLSLGYWAKYKREGFSTKGIIILLILSSLICMSHLFVFAVLLLILFILNLKNIVDLFNRDRQAKIINEIGQQLLFVLPGLIIAVLYFVTNPVGESNFSFPSFDYLLKLIRQVQPIKAMSYGKESIYAPWILYTLLVLTIVSFFYKLRLKNRSYSLESSSWGIITLVFLISLFTMPDVMNVAIGFVSSRLVFFFFLFLIVWLAAQKAPLWLKVTAFIIINYVNVALVRVYVRSTEESNQLVHEIVEASKIIEPYSTVLPITNTMNWLYPHTSNYLGVDKPMILLENYEVSLGHFPLMWNYDQLPNLKFGELEQSAKCLTWPGTDESNNEAIEYVFLIIGQDKPYSQDCRNQINNHLGKFYTLEYCSNDKRIKLYKLKSTPAS